MLLIQLTGLSGAGKTTLAECTANQLTNQGYAAAIIDGDDYRKTICKDLGFSREDRIENMNRLAQVGLELLQTNTIVLIAAINPYEAARKELQQLPFVKTIWVDCQLAVLKKRDPKGLYQRADLPPCHPEKLTNLTGINDPFELPGYYDLKIDTSSEAVPISAGKMLNFVLCNLVLPHR